MVADAPQKLQLAAQVMVHEVSPDCSVESASLPFPSSQTAQVFVKEVKKWPASQPRHLLSLPEQIVHSGEHFTSQMVSSVAKAVSAILVLPIGHLEQAFEAFAN